MQRSRAHRPDQLGWRPVQPAGTGGAAQRETPARLEKQGGKLHQKAQTCQDAKGNPEPAPRVLLVV